MTVTHLMDRLAKRGESSKLLADPHSINTGLLVELIWLRPDGGKDFQLKYFLQPGWLDWTVAVESLKNSFIPQIKLITTLSKSELSGENNKI